MTIRVIVIEGHLLALQAISTVLNLFPDIEIVATDTGMTDLLRSVRETQPDIVVLDVSVRVCNQDPAVAVETLKRVCPTVRILILISCNDAIFVPGILDAGAEGCLFSNDEQLLSLGTVLRKISGGKRVLSQRVAEEYFDHSHYVLTPQQLTILRLAAEGLTNDAIAERLAITNKTVRNRLSNIYTKLGISKEAGVNNRVDAINIARRLNLL